MVWAAASNSARQRHRTSSVSSTNVPPSSARNDAGSRMSRMSIPPGRTNRCSRCSTSGSSSGGYSHSHTWVDNYCNGCGQFKDTVVAAIGKKGYETVAAAITAANGSGTVTLLKATTETIQEILDGQYGSIDGLTIELPTGNYGQLELGRATKYEGSNTKYYLGGIESSPDAIKQNMADHPNGGAGKREYVRSMSNVTLKAADGATVNVAGVKMTSGHMYGSSGAPNYDYVLDRKVFSTNDSYYLAQTVSNIAFVGLNFTAKSDINTSIPESTINGFTFKNCTFNINNTAEGNQAIRYYNENNNGKVSDLKVINCTFTNCRHGVYTSHIKNIFVTNSEFDTTGHNAIAIQDFNGACDHGKVIITGNTFKNIGDRIIRFNNVGAGTQITITHNTVIGKLIKKEVIKAEFLAAGVTCNIHSNSWGDGATFGGGFTEETGEPCAEINGVKYISLAKALIAAKDGDTVTVLDDVTTEMLTIPADKTLTLNTNGKSITNNSGNYAINNLGTLTIQGGGKIIRENAGNSAIRTIGALTLENVEVKVNDGMIAVKVDENGVGTKGTLIVNDGTVLTAESGQAIQAWGDVTINDGTLNGEVAAWSVKNWNPGNITIKGGQINGDVTAYQRLKDGNYPDQSAKIAIEGGNITGELKLRYVEFNSTITDCDAEQFTVKGSITVTGGTYSSDPSEYVAEGYIARTNNDGKYVVSMVGTEENPYTLNEFNALTKLPAGRTELYVDIGDVSLADGDVTIGNKDICDMWTWDRDTGHKVGEILEDGRKVYMVRDTDTIYSSNKAGITLYISGSVKENPEGGLNQSDSHVITFSIPDASNVVFTKDFTVNGYFRMHTGWSDGRKRIP